MVLLLMMTGFLNSAFSQRLADTALFSMNRDQLGVYFQTKARKQNTLGWIMLDAGLVGLVITSAYSIGALNSDNEDLFRGVLAVSSASIAGGVAAFISSANNKGKAEMLLRKPARAEGPEVEPGPGDHLPAQA